MAAAADDHEVHEAFGPALSGLEAGSAITLGVIALLIGGVVSVLLGALADEHRLSDQGIGFAAMLEALTMAATTGLAGAVLEPVRLRTIGVVSALVLAALDFATVKASGGGVLIMRAIVGVPEGLLLWICIGMIARTVTPERWAGVLLTALTLAQLGVASACAAVIVPRLHANGGFLFLGAISLFAAPIALLVPSRYAPLPQAPGQSGPLPARGWVALAACLLLGASSAAVGVYLIPLAHHAGLSTGVGATANAVSLGAQVIGGLVATLSAGRLKYFPVILGGSIAFFVAWIIYGMVDPAWLFIAASALFGFVLLLIGPFFVPMTIDADPSRRTAVQSGAAQVLGGALGPLLAALVVTDQSARGVLVLGAVLVTAGLLLAGWLHFSHRSAAA